MENDCIPAASVPMLVSDLARLGAVPNDFPLSHVLAETCTVYRMAFIIDPDREAYSQEELIQAAEKLELQGAADDYQDSVIKTIAQYEVVLELQKEKKEETAHTEKLLDCLRQQLTHYVRARAVAVCVSKPRMKVAAEDRVVRALVDIFRFYTKQHALAHVRKTFDAVNAELSQMGLGYFTKLLKDYNIEADQKTLLGRVTVALSRKKVAELESLQARQTEEIAACDPASPEALEAQKRLDETGRRLAAEDAKPEEEVVAELYRHMGIDHNGSHKPFYIREKETNRLPQQLVKGYKVLPKEVAERIREEIQKLRSLKEVEKSRCEEETRRTGRNPIPTIIPVEPTPPKVAKVQSKLRLYRAAAAHGASLATLPRNELLRNAPVPVVPPKRAKNNPMQSHGKKKKAGSSLVEPDRGFDPAELLGEEDERGPAKKKSQGSDWVSTRLVAVMAAGTESQKRIPRIAGLKALISGEELQRAAGKGLVRSKIAKAQQQQKRGKRSFENSKNDPEMKAFLESLSGDAEDEDEPLPRPVVILQAERADREREERVGRSLEHILGVQNQRMKQGMRVVINAKAAHAK